MSHDDTVKVVHRLYRDGVKIYNNNELFLLCFRKDPLLILAAKEKVTSKLRSCLGLGKHSKEGCELAKMRTSASLELAVGLDVTLLRI